MNPLMHISPLDNLAGILSGSYNIWSDARKDYRCHECRNWFEETNTFFDEEETGDTIELCDECLEIYK